MALHLTNTNSRADRFSYPEPLQPLNVSIIQSKWRNKFIGTWVDGNAAMADGRRFPEIVEKAIEGILQEGATLTAELLTKQEYSHEDLAAQLRKVQNSSQQEILKSIVRLYTYETFLYRFVNSALRNEDMSKVNTLGAFSFLLQFYLFNTPQDTIMDDGKKCDTVYRKVAFSTEEQRKKEVTKCEKYLGQPMRWLGFTSTSKSFDEAEGFMNSNEEKHKILYFINIVSNKHGLNRKADISMISSKSWEKEVLFMSGCQFTIDRIEHGEPTKIYMSS